jgi:hypothetical protein
MEGKQVVPEPAPAKTSPVRTAANESPLVVVVTVAPPPLPAPGTGTKNKPTVVSPSEPSAQRGCAYWFIRCCEFSFFDDDNLGVPPLCCWSICPLNHGFFVNFLYPAIVFGKCGLAYFDKHRRILFGFSSHVTLLAFFLGIWGCLALTLDPKVVQRAYWVGARATDAAGKDYVLYVGLRSVLYVDCPFLPGWDAYPSSCTVTSLEFRDNACYDGPMSDACQACEGNAKTMWTTAFFGCSGLILAWLGQQTRIRPVADTPVQKLMGVFSEVMGILSTGVAMYKFNNDCRQNLIRVLSVDHGWTVTYKLGPGYICLLLVCFSSVVRFIINSMIPLPLKPSVAAGNNKGGAVTDPEMGGATVVPVLEEHKEK